VLELVLGLVRELALARELVPELVLALEPGSVLVLEPGLARVRVLGLVLALEPGLVLARARVLELAAEEEELGVEALDFSALVRASLNIQTHSMVKKVARLFELRWMEAAMWLMQLQKAAAAKSMKLR
jgi:hypothetical protein